MSIICNRIISLRPEILNGRFGPSPDLLQRIGCPWAKDSFLKFSLSSSFVRYRGKSLQLTNGIKFAILIQKAEREVSRFAFCATCAFRTSAFLCQLILVELLIRQISRQISPIDKRNQVCYTDPESRERGIRDHTLCGRFLEDLCFFYFNLLLIAIK